MNEIDRTVERAMRFAKTLVKLDALLDEYAINVKKYHDVLRESAVAFDVPEEERQSYLENINSFQIDNERDFKNLSETVADCEHTVKFYPRIEFAQEYVSMLRRKIEQLRKVKASIGSDLFDQEYEAYEAIK